MNPNLNNDPPPPPVDGWIGYAGNPNFNNDPPPGSLNALPAIAASQPGEQLLVQQHVPTFGFGVGFAPAVELLPPLLPMALPIGIPFGPFLGPGMHSAGPLAPPRMPWNTPGLFGNPSSQYGSTVPGMPGLGFPPSVSLPPAPPGLVGTTIPPFLPTVPPWLVGNATVVAAGVGAVGAPFNMLGGVSRPAPPIITEASGNAQPSQGDITQIPGGVPPGATHVESAEHTIVHVLKGPQWPWLNHGASMMVEILHVGSSTGMNRLIEICNENQKAEGLALSECHEMVNGMWEKGQTFIFDDTISKVVTIKDIGWDNKRNRPGGQSLHVYLHPAGC